MKRLSCFVFVVLILFPVFLTSVSGADFTKDIDCGSAVLIEASTGRVLYEKNADMRLAPASVTKIMTLLLVCEALDKGTVRLDDLVPVSEYAASMGGSQIYLKAGEKMTLSDMLKSVTVASANDSAVALAEYISGSEESFVAQMNKRARELGMENTNFENVTGLDDSVTNHYTTARDISVMSRELISRSYILKYTSIWMDTVRDGAFGLTNTNKLVRFYEGCNGLKTGYTSKAKYCVSATAKRDKMQLIAVIMAAPTSAVRNAAAASLLDFGFANYGVYTVSPAGLDSVLVKGSDIDTVGISHGQFTALVAKSDMPSVTYTVHLPEYLTAPVAQGEKVGHIEFTLNGECIGTVDLTADRGCERMGFLQILGLLFKNFLFKA